MADALKENPVAARCFTVGTAVHAVEPVSGDLNTWLRRTKIQRFDSATGKESWFYLFNTDHISGFVSRSETVRQGRWDGPGWYRTRIRRVGKSSWLILDKGDIAEAFKRRFHLSDIDRLRFDEFVKTLPAT